ncbi:MAG TPA: histidine phosphatase family protein [Candidatus Wallbacteria bacterium]|nr:histidine phosphatase family protein [Candidatus Wallbacteria bacterium]
MKTIYLVRHAPVNDGSDDHPIFKGVIDVPLSASGEIQAAGLAMKFNGIVLDRVYCGPLQRVRRTAELIAQENCFEKIVVAEHLNDINCGVWEGMKVSDVIERFPAEFKTWRNFPASFTFPGGESVSAAASRAFEFFKEAAFDNGAEMMAFVTHRFVINAIILKALDISLDKYWHFRYDCCGISKLLLDDGIFTAVKLNAELP